MTVVALHLFIPMKSFYLNRILLGDSGSSLVSTQGPPFQRHSQNSNRQPSINYLRTFATFESVTFARRPKEYFAAICQRTPKCNTRYVPSPMNCVTHNGPFSGFMKRYQSYMWYNISVAMCPTPMS